MSLALSLKIDEKIDLDNLADKIQQTLFRALRQLANAAMGEWQDEAGRRLHRTRRQYQSAIKTHVVSEDQIDIVLHHPDEKINWLVTAIEVGVESYSVKQALLDSAAARQWSQHHKGSPGGKKLGAPFVDVPFRTGDAKEQSRPSYFRRVSPSSSKTWTHPGFKPAGGGGLDKPIREHVKQYIEEEAEKMFGHLLNGIQL